MSHNKKKNNRREPVCEELPVDQPQEQPEDLEEQTSQIIQSGSVTMTAAKHVIHCLTIVGQIEGHYILPPQNKTTKYEHVIPQLVAIEQDPSIEGLMIILNTVGGDVEAGLAIAELISGMKKPTVSLVLGGGHSIGVPLAVSAKKSFIVPSATMTIHPVRMNGTIIAVPQAFEYLAKIQERIVDFITSHSHITAERLRFDFSHEEKMTPEQLKQAEDLVNDAIRRDLPITCEEMSVEEAKKSGAMGLFENKYTANVKVYTMGDASKEICGGPHASHTGELGHFRIVKEESSSRGVRRIKAVLEHN